MREEWLLGHLRSKILREGRCEEDGKVNRDPNTY